MPVSAYQEILVVHVLMPISATVPSILWQEDTKAEPPEPGTAAKALKRSTLKCKTLEVGVV